MISGDFNFKNYTVKRVFLNISTSISVHLYRYSHVYRNLKRELVMESLAWLLRCEVIKSIFGVLVDKCVSGTVQAQGFINA